MNRDQNGKRVTRSVRQESDGTWSALVWFGSGVVTDVRRQYGYATRAAARAADISDFPNVKRSAANDHV